MKHPTLLLFLLFAAKLAVVGQIDMAKPFIDCGVEGSITIYNLSAGTWITSDSADSRTGTLPASTFKILNTLIALECGAIKDENEIIKYPGTTDTTKYGYRPDIYHDMSVKEAFKVSAVWVYIELAKRIGKEKYHEYLASCNYGNADITVDDIDFWNFGSLAISPVNEIEFLKGVYEETLPFKKQNFSIIKSMMLEEQTDNYTLRAKTGRTSHDGKDIGWWVGWVERKDDVYFFATRLLKDSNTVNSDFGSCRKTITRSILKEMGIID